MSRVAVGEAVSRVAVGEALSRVAVGEALSRVAVGEAVSRVAVGEAVSRVAVGEAVSRVAVGEAVSEEKVAIDLVGPLKPVSDRRHRWILTLVDFATRYPETVALKSIDTEAVAEALIGIFSRVGLPNYIISDNGSQFFSGLMKEVARLLSITCVCFTPYHPQSNGLYEKWNVSLKARSTPAT